MLSKKGCNCMVILREAKAREARLLKDVSPRSGVHLNPVARLDEELAAADAKTFVVDALDVLRPLRRRRGRATDTAPFQSLQPQAPGKTAVFNRRTSSARVR